MSRAGCVARTAILRVSNQLRFTTGSPKKQRSIRADPCGAQSGILGGRYGGECTEYRNDPQIHTNRHTPPNFPPSWLAGRVDRVDLDAWKRRENPQRARVRRGGEVVPQSFAP